ncbi:hypothetical protein SprV_0200574100 [Sparganum proliferum]
MRPPLVLISASSRDSHIQERKTALVAREFAGHKVDIGASSDIRFSENGHIWELGVGYAFCQSGRPKAEQPDAGVTFVIRDDIVRLMFCRLMTLQLLLRENEFATVIEAYAVLR